MHYQRDPLMSEFRSQGMEGGGGVMCKMPPFFVGPIERTLRLAIQLLNVDGEVYNDELVSFGQKLHSRNDNRK